MGFNEYMYNLLFGAAGQALKKSAQSAPSQAVPEPTSFDPYGSGYDYTTAEELRKLYPLTMEKPTSYMGDYVSNEGAFQSWVWHPELNDYKVHWASRDPRTGMLLKGLKHPTWGLTMQEEEKLGNKVIFKDGRYYSFPDTSQKSQMSFMDEILNTLKSWKSK